jgi:DNA recombination protein RmuC
MLTARFASARRFEQTVLFSKCSGIVVARCHTEGMDPLLALIIGLVIGVVLGGVIGVLLSRSRSTSVGANPAVIAARHEAAIAQVQAADAAERSILASELASMQATAAGLQQQVATAQQQYTDLVDRTRKEAVLEQERQQKESKVLQALTPVQESLRTMQLKVTELETQRSLQHGELSQQLRNSLDSEQNLRNTAESLASALRNNSTRGVWGETQLRRLVESAGLLEHVDFSEQLSVNSDAGAGRIDMVVHLSDGKSLAIDAKVPFDAFLEANAIPLTAVGLEADRRVKLMADHSRAMRGHVDALAKREYWEGLPTSPELVIGFIPSESLLAAALESDPGLLDYAFRKNVALASPVSLWAVLKTVAYSWRQESIGKDAKRIFDLSNELYGRLRTLAEHSESLRRAIESTVSSYNKFASSLESRVLVSARKIVDGGDPSQAIAEVGHIDSTPKAITSPLLIGDDV